MYTKEEVKELAKEIAAFALVIVVIVLAIHGLVKANDYINASLNKPVQNATAYQVAEELLALKIRVLEDSVLAKLALCETGGVQEPDGAITFDTNRKASVGRYQFQITTVQHYHQLIYGVELNRAQSIMLAINPAPSTELAREIIFNTEDGIENWRACDKKHNLALEISLINRLK